MAMRSIEKKRRLRELKQRERKEDRQRAIKRETEGAKLRVIKDTHLKEQLRDTRRGKYSKIEREKIVMERKRWKV